MELEKNGSFVEVRRLIFTSPIVPHIYIYMHTYRYMIIFYSCVLYCIILYCIVLYYIVLYFIVLHYYIILYYVILFLYFITLYLIYENCDTYAYVFMYIYIQHPELCPKA